MRKRLRWIGGLCAVALATAGVTVGATGAEPDPEEGPRITEQRVSIPAGDHQIPAVMTTPARGGAREFPAVLLVHGFASTKDEVGDMYKRLAARLAARGVASLRFDFPGSGESTQPFTVNTVAYQVAETRRALDYLVAAPRIDEDRVGLVGFSLGGIVGSAVAGSDARVRALALWSTPGDTAASFQDLYSRHYAEAVEKGSVTVDLGFRTVELSRAFFESLFSSFPLSDIRSYSGPLLVIAGEEDPPQPRYARQFVLNAGSLDATLRIVPGASHIFNVLDEDQTEANLVIRLTSRWLAQRLSRLDEPD